MRRFAEPEAAREIRLRGAMSESQWSDTVYWSDSVTVPLTSTDGTGAVYWPSTAWRYGADYLTGYSPVSPQIPLLTGDERRALLDLPSPRPEPELPKRAIRLRGTA